MPAAAGLLDEIGAWEFRILGVRVLGVFRGFRGFAVGVWDLAAQEFRA